MSTKCKGKLMKKILCLVMACMICSQICAVNSMAATKSWSLCRTNGPSSEWKTKSVINFTTTKSSTKVTCDKVGGGAVAHVDTTNGIHGHFSAAGSMTVTTAVGVSYKATFGYEKYGNSYNNPSGKIIY